MDLLRHVLLVLHVLGLVALLGGLLVQARRPTRSISPLMRDGAGTAFVAGLLLAGVVEGGDGSPDHAEIVVETVLGLVVLVLVLANLRRERIATGLWALLLLLTAAQICVTIFWGPTHS